MVVRYMKENIGNKYKWDLEWYCEGGGYLTILSRSQYGNEISRD